MRRVLHDRHPGLLRDPNDVRLPEQDDEKSGDDDLDEGNDSSGCLSPSLGWGSDPSPAMTCHRYV